MCVGQKNKIRPCIIPHTKLTSNRERLNASPESVVGMCFNNRLHARHTQGAEFSHQTHRPVTIKLVRGSMEETGSFSLDNYFFFPLRSNPQRQKQTNELPQNTEILCIKGSNHGMRDLQNM